MKSKSLVFSSLFVVLIACRGTEADQEGQPSSPQEAVDRGLAGELAAKASNGSACSLLKGAVPGVVDVDLEAAHVRDVELMGHDLCTVTWTPGPDEPSKMYDHEVSLTVMGTEFDSRETAVASLESAVASLSEGVTVNVQGKSRTTKSKFGDWIDGVGDRAITRRRSVLATAGARRFEVVVRVADDDARNQAIAIELARRIADAI